MVERILATVIVFTLLASPWMIRYVGWWWRTCGPGASEEEL